MATNKTTRTEGSVMHYLNEIKDPLRRNDCSELVRLLQEKTGFQPILWGTSIVGFGSYHYQYESGRSGEAPLVGLSSRANAIVIYLAAEFDTREALLNELGTCKTGKGCLYIQKRSDINQDVLVKLVRDSIQFLQHTYEKPK